MSFSPLFNILDTKGFNILANFPPNNWEIKEKIKTNNVVSFYTNGKNGFLKIYQKLNQIVLSDFLLKSSAYLILKNLIVFLQLFY